MHGFVRNACVHILRVPERQFFKRRTTGQLLASSWFARVHINEEGYLGNLTI